MSKSIIALVAAAASAVAAFAPAQAAGLDAYLWKARPVVVFASDPIEKEAAEQIGRLRKASALLAERQMPVLIVSGENVAALDRAAAVPSGVDAAALRRANRVEEGVFTVVLIGKDGGEKLRSEEPVDIDRLMSLVDTMPMRRQEQRS